MMIRYIRYITLTIGITLVLGGLQACSGHSTTDKKAPLAQSAVQSATPSDPTGFRYPPARWRLAMFDELNRTTLWFGHIAIRHEKSQTESFRPGLWQPDPPNPNRSVAEALTLAEQVAARAVAAPDTFEQLALQYSEDIVTRNEGGILGGNRASQITDTGFLDVLAVLKPGEVSKPFRTPYGFHILKRYAPPNDETVSGERIVIGYQGVFGKKENPRSRDEALKLATKVAMEAKSGTRDFRTLVDEYSDGIDPTVHGDMGVFSTRDPEYLPREVYHLAKLEIGEVMGPIDSHFGFEILKRVPATPRVEYAMAAIAFPFVPGPDLREASMADALHKAEAAGRELTQQPERFEEFQQIHRSEKIRRWAEGEGRGDPMLSRALDELAMGEVAKKPLLYGSAYWVIKRLDPDTLPPREPILTELPKPDAPDFEALLRVNNGQQIAGAARSLAEAIQKSTAFSAEGMQRIGETLSNLATRLEQNPDDGSAVHVNVHCALASLKEKLSVEQFNRFKSFGQNWAIRIMMPSASVE